MENSEINIAVVNISTVVTNDEVLQATSDLQTQVTRDFYPIWGLDAKLTFYANQSDVPKGQWWIIVSDTSDQAGAGGYHDLTSEGKPLGKVFAKTDMDSGSNWTVAFSHELLEMLEDPYINLCAEFEENNGNGYMVGYELCDPVEDDKFGYKIGSTLASDFVFPEYFEDTKHAAGTKYDFKGNVSKPLEILTGGYLGIQKFNGQGWQQITSDISKLSASKLYASRAKVGSRRERRDTPRAQWVRSKFGKA
jgi:hypothetical protein